MDMERIISDGLAGRLSDVELADLALQLAGSGDRLSLPSKATADLASTGGPTSLSTLLGPLWLAASGWVVPKLGVAGRPAGGIDVMSLVPGYRVEMTRIEALKVIDHCGYAHLEAGTIFSPADGHLFNLRQQRGAQAVPALAIASLLAKKLAVGVRSVLLDVRTAPFGNFGANVDEARANAKRFCRVANLLGIKGACVVTDACAPYQPFVGRSEALLGLAALFSGQGDAWCRSHVEDCGDWIENAFGFNGSKRPSIPDLEKVFIKNLLAQGATTAAFGEAVEKVRTAPRFTIASEREGNLSYDVGLMRSVLLVDQQESPGGHYPDGAGVILHVPPGARIRKGDAIFSVRLKRTDWNPRRAALKPVAIIAAENLGFR